MSSRPAILPVMADVAAGLRVGHGRHGVAQPDALIERGEHAESQPLPQGGLADEQARERARESMSWLVKQPDRFELVIVEQVGFVDDQDGGAAPFGVFGGQRVGGLGGQGGVVGRGCRRGWPRCGGEHAAHPDGGVGQVDDHVPARSRLAGAARTATVLPAPTAQATDCNSFVRCCRAISRWSMRGIRCSGSGCGRCHFVGDRAC